MSGSVDEKLATVVARKIANEIQQRGWVVGEKLGTEPDLLKRFKVSREPFREAIRILERQGIVRAERGWNGGLIVQAPALTAVSQILKTYFEFADVSFDEITEAQLILQKYALEVAVQRMTPAHANDIRRTLIKPRPVFRSRDQEGQAIMNIYNAINRVADNSSLSMLIYTLSRTIADFGHQERYPKQLWQSMITQTWSRVEQMADCVMCGDAAGAKAAVSAVNDLVDKVVRGLERHNQRIWNTRSFVAGSYSSATLTHDGRNKAAANLSYRIAAHIRRNQLEPGTTLGSESALMKKFAVSRAMFREAVRMLEFFGIVTVKRGIEGGLTVSEPNPGSTVHTAVLYMRYFKPEPGELNALLDYLDTQALALAAKRASHSDVIALVERINAATEATGNTLWDHAEALRHRGIALSENRALTLISDILVAVQREDSAKPLSKAAQSRALTQIAAAAKAIVNAAKGPGTAPLETALCKLHAVLRGILTAGI